MVKLEVSKQKHYFDYQGSDNRTLTKESIDKTWVYLKHQKQLSNDRILSEAYSWSGI